jgi:F-type H+-transporting ATPase subunit delta
MARSTTAARRYAEAAFEIALRDGTVETWRRDLDQAAEVIADPEIAEAVHNPALATALREEAIAKGLASSVSAPVLNLIMFMVRRGRIEELSRVAAEFRRLDDERNGVTHATATSASPLEASEIQALTTRLETMTGGKVELTVETDPSVLGGLIVRVGDRLIDGSVRGRLERLRSQLVSGAL